jgi:LysM repeat protein
VGDSLYVGDELGLGQSLSQGSYTLTLQDDGDLVLTEPGTVVWATNTPDQGVRRAVLQEDGNFVLYKSDGSAWSTQTNGQDVDRLILQSDRNLVLYARDGGALWASDTDTDTSIVAEEAAVMSDPGAAPPSAQTYTVEPGDSLWAIAERFYGDGNRYRDIAQANGIANPDLVNVGQALTIP